MVFYCPLIKHLEKIIGCNEPEETETLQWSDGDTLFTGVTSCPSAVINPAPALAVRLHNSGSRSALERDCLHTLGSDGLPLSPGH